MTEHKVGHCLPLYLQNMLVLSALEDGSDMPDAMTEDQQLLAAFRERASDQALGMLEETYNRLLAGSSPVPYRSDRRSQRRTVREYWYMEGRLYRPRERTARTFWNLHLGCLRDRGPSISYIVGPQECRSPAAMDDLAADVAPVLGLESANVRNCFTHKTGYEVGVVAGTVSISAGVTYPEVVKGLKEKVDAFFAKFRAQLEVAVDA